MDVNDFWLDKIDATINSLADKCRQVREENIELLRVIQRLEARLDTAINERDEARRTYCHAVSGGIVTPSKIARQNGWDCFNTEV